MQFHILNNEVDSSVQHLLWIWYLLRTYFRSSCHQIIIKRSFTVHTVRPQSNPFVMCKHICSTNYVYIMYLLFLKFEYMNSNITRILLFCEYFSALQAESNLSHIIVSLHIHYIQSFRPYTYKIFTWINNSHRITHTDIRTHVRILFHSIYIAWVDTFRFHLFSSSRFPTLFLSVYVSLYY